MPISLRTLEAQFIKRTETGYQIVETLPEADGLEHVCPTCYEKKGGLVGAHSMIEWFRGKVPDGISPGPGRWTPTGTSIDDLSFVPGTPPHACSVQQGEHTHFHITNGQVILC